MAPLKGYTLGEKHRNYNRILQETIAKGAVDLTKINYDDDDVDNMMRIDIACKERNVDYILDVLKCDDMLYVSRAIKRSVWLITEQEYAHIMNPDYLHSNVFPEMLPKAITKLMLHIKRHLIDEKRVEGFFTYVDKNDQKMALKWLENCSLQFTEKIVASKADIISPSTLKRLCKKSVIFLKIYVDNVDTSNRISFDSVMFLLKSNTEEFLKIIESLPNYRLYWPKFNDKHTHILMKNSFQRIVDNFNNNYRNFIDLPTFVKYLKINQVDIISFLLSNCESCWKKFDNLKPFLAELPPEENITFLRKLYYVDDDDDDSDSDSDITEEGSSNDENTELEILFSRIKGYQNHTFKEFYQWYEIAPFESAFLDLKKYIQTNSSAVERHSILIVLLKCARKNIELIRIVLQYYHDKHINEPYVHKIRFVNTVLELHDAFRFDDTTWSILNEIFHSLEVYIHSTNKVQQCIITVILYRLLQAQPVPEVVEQKFTFDTLKDIKKKLNIAEKDIVFNYLYNLLIKKLQALDINTEMGITQAVTLLENIWMLIKDWKKEATHHQFVIDNINKFIDLNKQLNRDTDMRYLYCLVKPYHRQLFENSMIMYPCEEMCIHALKRDPGLLVRNKSEVSALCYNDSVSLKTLLSKLRIYWRETLASEWRNTFLNDCKKVNGYEAVVRGIFVLTPQKPLLDFIKTYAPSDNKIQWNEGIEIEIRLQKHIAKNLHLARPQLPAEVVLWYAKGDYLQYAQLSLNVIYRNMRKKNIEKQLKVLLSAPVSLQKHGIRLASKRMQIEELLDIFISIWKSTRNSSIRAVLFTSVFDFLGKAQDTLVINVWEVLSFMIDDLNHEENKTIYFTLGNVRVVPLSVIGGFYRKSYLFLRDLPERIGFRNLFDSVLSYATDVIQYLEPEFVENNVLVSVYDIFSKNSRIFISILSAYLLCSKDEKTQMQKYKNLFEPLFEQCLAKWKNKEFDTNIITSFQSILDKIAINLPQYVLDMKMVSPVQMLTCIQNMLDKELCHEELYGVITHWKLSVAYIKLLQEIMIEKPEKCNTWEEIRQESINKYSKLCLEFLKEDIDIFFPSIYMLFADAMKQSLNSFDIKEKDLLNMLNNMLLCEDLQVYLLVLKFLPVNYYSSDYTYVEIRKKLYSYPSDEIKIHYFTMFNERYKSKSDSEQDEDSVKNEDSEKDENSENIKTSDSE